MRESHEARTRSCGRVVGDDRRGVPRRQPSGRDRVRSRGRCRPDDRRLHRLGAERGRAHRRADSGIWRRWRPRRPRHPRARSDERRATPDHAEPRPRGDRLPDRFGRRRGGRRPDRKRDRERARSPDRQPLRPSRIRRRRPAGGNRRRRRQGLPVVIAVPARYLDAWNAFAGGLDAQLPPSRAEIEAWWAAVAPPVRRRA